MNAPVVTPVMSGADDGQEAQASRLESMRIPENGVAFRRRKINRYDRASLLRSRCNVDILNESSG